MPKHARRLAGFNEQVLSLYARGMSVRDIRSHVVGMYGVEVSPDLVSKVTDAVAYREVATCQPTTIREKTSMTNAAYTQPENVRIRVVGVGPGRGAGVSTGPFPGPALRTGRARFRASGSPRVHAVVAADSVALAVQGVVICVPRYR